MFHKLHVDVLTVPLIRRKANRW